MAPLTALNAARDAALIALEADDYAGARKQALKAQAVLAMIPDSEIASVSKQSWDRKAIADFLTAIRQAEQIGQEVSEPCDIQFCDIEFSDTSGGCDC